MNEQIHQILNNHWPIGFFGSIWPWQQLSGQNCLQRHEFCKRANKETAPTPSIKAMEGVEIWNLRSEENDYDLKPSVLIKPFRHVLIRNKSGKDQKTADNDEKYKGKVENEAARTELVNCFKIRMKILAVGRACCFRLDEQWIKVESEQKQNSQNWGWKCEDGNVEFVRWAWFFFQLRLPLFHLNCLSRLSPRTIFICCRTLGNFLHFSLFLQFHNLWFDENVGGKQSHWNHSQSHHRKGQPSVGKFQPQMNRLTDFGSLDSLQELTHWCPH